MGQDHKPSELVEASATLGAHDDVWAEIVHTKKGMSARVTLTDPQVHGWSGISTLEIRGIESDTPRCIVTPEVGAVDELMEPVDIVDRETKIEIFGKVAAIILGGISKK